MELYEQFPHIYNEKIIVKKMIEDDLDNLFEITNNDNVYKYIPLFLYKKSKGNLLAAIRNLGNRDFDKKKCIIAGVYLCNNPDKLIGMAEMFNYKKRDEKITIGYRINELYWHQGIATNIVDLLTKYLSDEIGIKNIQAFVMPNNIYSSKALLRNGFQKENYFMEEKNWGGQDIVDVEVYTYRKTLQT
ncbi:GNAT family protein [Anaerocolumna sp. AGMB13025]|uniref:GNAT family N-acetyltransferase n=1 Tax=Anaerocolumna sp. AGMB13025 TaxID=3039116 RepID=UPI00241BEBE9|nr:GNAT family protein [Anaerocolumna sp. AGMB13025]WFR55628.1 GNAT family protein [Anaerocolumna sp. AGMB13025]